MNRKPAVAGTFYPASPDKLIDMLDAFAADEPEPQRQPRRTLAILVPHAGYVYSGAVATAVYTAVEPPDVAVILCPNHTGLGRRISLWAGDAWETPLGTVPVDRELAESIQAHCPEVQLDIDAHRMEHAIEVQLPFLQRLNPKIQIVPIVLATRKSDTIQSLGRGIAEAVREHPTRTLLVASSDMTHYEDHPTAKAKDQLAIDAMLALNEVELAHIVATRPISMCGCAPATAIITAAKQLGARQAVMQRYQTSGEINGDFEQVVGYAGITFH